MKSVNKKRLIISLCSLAILCLIVVFCFLLKKDTITVVFDSSGGSQIKAQVIKMGGKAIKPDNPTRKGYSFVRWQYQGKKYNFETPIYKDLLLKAIWEKQQDNKVLNSNYVITVRLDNEIKTMEVDSLEDIHLDDLGFEEKPGYVIKWYVDGKEFDDKISLTQKMVIVGKYEKVISYKVIFDSTGGSKISNQMVEDGKKVSKPKDPAREGFTFKGWYFNDKIFDFNTNIKEDITLVAKWTKNAAKIYKVTFESNGGSTVLNQTVKDGEKVARPKDPVKDKYTFDGWLLNGKLYDFNTPIRDNITLTATWSSVCKFSLRAGNSIDVARNNLENMNSVLQCANNNGITSLTVPRGDYYFYVIKAGDRDVWASNPILINFSNINLDLNGSVFHVYKNGSIAYDLFHIDRNAENVVIRNGTLIGDRYEHTCQDGSQMTCGSEGGLVCSFDRVQSHEHGFGIRIETLGVIIENLTITNMMGDGIYIRVPKPVLNSKTGYITIRNNVIDNCRRNGIAIIQVGNLNVINNTIRNTHGTRPQVGIDIERNMDVEFYKDILIEGNTIYNSKRFVSIKISTGLTGSLRIRNNHFDAPILGLDRNNGIKLETEFITIDGNDAYSPSGAISNPFSNPNAAICFHNPNLLRRSWDEMEDFYADCGVEKSVYEKKCF